MANAKKIAEFLCGHPNVAWVKYPSLEGSKYYDLAQKYLPKGAGSIFSFGIKGGLESGKKFVENLELFSFLANVGIPSPWSFSRPAQPMRSCRKRNSGPPA